MMMNDAAPDAPARPSTKRNRRKVRDLLSALSFERHRSQASSSRGRGDQDNDESTAANGGADPADLSKSLHVQVNNMLHGTLDPDGGVEVVFYDAHQFGDEDEDRFRVDFRRESVVMSSIRQISDDGIETVSNHFDYDDEEDGVPSPPRSVRNGALPRAPPPPHELPLRFLRAGKGDPAEGLRRYKQTLDWRRQERIDTILREPNEHFLLIKRHYPHFCHGKGKNGEPCFYEQPPKTDLKALRAGGVTLQSLLRHYIFVTEYQWQYLERDDLQNSIYIIDLEGIRFGDFVGEVVDFVKTASSLSATHYPERAGYVFVINVPVWFKAIFAVIRPLVDESTLEKIYILRGADEIRSHMQERIDLDNIPADYGGNSVLLGESEQEKDLRRLVEHNNDIARGENPCTGPRGSPPCAFCSWAPARSY